MSAFQKLTDCLGGRMYTADARIVSGKGLAGTAFNLDKASASSLSSAGRCSTENLHFWCTLLYSHIAPWWHASLRLLGFDETGAFRDVHMVLKCA